MEPDDLQKRRHFPLEIEQSIRLSNQEVIQRKVPAVTRERILLFAVAVARLRSRYMEAAFRFAETVDHEKMVGRDVEDLRELRQYYEEARLAFEGLSRGIERGYVAVEF